MDKFFSDNLSDRQLTVALHTMAYAGATPEDVSYIKSEELPEDTFPIDLLIIKPTKTVDFYIMQTCGLSSYYFSKDIGRSELMMFLPKTWKPVFDKPEYNWPRELLLDIAYGVVENNRGTMIGQVYVPRQDFVYKDSGDVTGGILVLPEQFSLEFCEELIEDTYTKFLQVVPITKDNLEKIEEVGPAKFIEYDLHDTEGPQFVAKIQTKKLEGIDKIIKENEDALKD